MQNLSYQNKPWFIILFSLLAVTITFPEVLAHFGVDVDKAYVWAYNDLFVHNFRALKELVFPYGPLGFLKFPLPIGYNWEIGFAFAFLIRFLQSVYFLLAIKKYKGKLHIGSYILLVILLKVTSFDLAFASIALCAGIIVQIEKKWFTWIPIILLGSVALYVKFSIGMLTFALFFGFMGGQVLHKKISIPQLVSPIVFLIISIWMIGFSIFGQFDFPMVYIAGTLKISSAYSAILSLHPESNRVILPLSLAILVVGYMLIHRKKWKPEIFISLVFGLFIVWKHAIVREERWHVFLLVQYVLMMCLYLILFSEKRKFLTILLSCISIGLLWMYTRELGGVKQFIVNSNSHRSFYEQVKLFSAPDKTDGDADIEKLKIPAQWRNYIGNKTIDIYPWNLMYAYANQFNWVPRPSVQSSDLNEWLDKKVATFYSDEKAPDFVLWHRSEDHFGRDMGYFESRYLLNAGPYTVDALFSSYNPVFKTREYILLEKSSHAKKTEVIPGETISLRLNQMVKVPDTRNNLKASVHVSLSTWGKILSPVYKEPAFFIKYKWSDGIEYDYNILRFNSPSGIWIQPFMTSLSNPDPARYKVDSVGFFSSHPTWSSEEVSLTWLYDLSAQIPDKWEDTLLYTDRKYEHEIVTIQPYGYVDLFQIPIDSLPQENVELEVYAKVKQPQKAKSRIVVSIENGETNHYWTAIYNDGYLPARERWGTIACSRLIDFSGYTGNVLKIYFWNEGAIGFEATDVRLAVRHYPSVALKPSNPF